MMSAISVPEMGLRILVAFLAGSLIGSERETRGRPAGLRTTILACVASAVAMIIAETVFVEATAANPAGSARMDPTRLGAGILTGIGFLGAGTILRHENVIRGITTAATLWFVTVLGLAFGSGLFVLGALGLGIALVTLFVLPRLEHHIPSDFYATLKVTAALNALNTEELRSRVEALGPTVLNVRLSYDLERRQQTLTCELRLKSPQKLALSSKIVANLAGFPGVVQVEWT